MVPRELGVYLTQGLQGRDDQIDLLVDLFEQSQMVTVETANPMLDLISFAQDCTEFWVIDVENAGLAFARDLQGDAQEGLSFTNSLGLFPSDPLGSIEPTPADPPKHSPKPDHTTTRPLDANALVKRQQQFSSYSDSPFPLSSATKTGATLQYCGLKPSPPPLCAGYDFRHSSDTSLAGFIYLLPSSTCPDALHFQEYNIGIILLPEWRNRGVAVRALHLAIDIAFSRLNVHRIQAQLIDCHKSIQGLGLFTRM